MNGARLQVINTHFGLGRRERRAQAQALLGADWLGECPAPVVVAGDLNSLPGGQVYRSFAARMGMPIWPGRLASRRRPSPRAARCCASTMSSSPPTSGSRAPR